MVGVSLRQLLEAGVHFGHQTGRWNPKMKPFIFGKKNGIYIIDLQKTQAAWKDALSFLEQEAAQGGKVLFVGTKRQAQETIAEEATRCGQYYVNHRWLGGLLTNYQTIRKSIERYKDLEAMAEDGRFDLLPKKEVLKLKRELFKLDRNLVGIKHMGGLPDVVFVMDIRRERIAVDEALKLGIPVVAIVDTNCDPDGIDFVVPGNDDALRAIRLYCWAAANALLAGRGTYDASIEEAARERAEADQAKQAEADKAEQAAADQAEQAEPDKAEEVEEVAEGEAAEAAGTPDDAEVAVEGAAAEVEATSEEAQAADESAEADAPEKPDTESETASEADEA